MLTLKIEDMYGGKKPPKSLFTLIITIEEADMIQFLFHRQVGEKSY